MRLFLIRHGNTDWADARKHTGRTNVPLNAAGEQRARGLAERLAKEKFERVFTSPLIRAQRTCELAGFAGAELCDELMEWDYGAYEGKLTSEIQKERPGWNLFVDGAPGGESIRDVSGRAELFLTRVRKFSGDVAAFSHGHMIRMIAAKWLGLEAKAAQHFYTSTASVSILGYEHENTPVIQLLNWTANER